MSKVTKSHTLALSLLDAAPKKKVYHFSFIFRRNKLLSIGQNLLIESPKVSSFGKRYGVEKMKKWPYPHSEIDAISKLWGRVRLGPEHTIVNTRLDRSGKLRMSKPCKGCAEVINALGMRFIYSTEDGYEEESYD